MRVAGLGFRGAATPEDLHGALVAAGGTEGLTALATLEAKAGSPALLAIAARLGLPILPIGPELLGRQIVQSRSPRVTFLHGTGSVAEAAALAGAGKGARLRGPRAISAGGMAAAAIAEGQAT